MAVDAARLGGSNVGREVSSSASCGFVIVVVVTVIYEGFGTHAVGSYGIALGCNFGFKAGF